MPQPGPRPDGGGTTVRRCTRCGAVVEGTRHTRAGYTVGHYALHTGPTEESTIHYGLDEVLTYRRLVRAVEVLCCPRCFDTPAARRLWQTFGDTEAPA
jgi:hypothetical protein